VTPRLARNWPALTAVLLLAAAVLVYTHALGTRTNYDEGVYLASLDAMRRGQALGTDIYTSQPPVFYWLLRALAAPFGSSIPAIRVGFALIAVVGVTAALALGWRLYGPPAGVAGAALVAIGPPYPSVAPTVSADVPAVVIGLVSLALLTFALPRDGPRPWAGAAGALLSLAVLTKLLAIHLPQRLRDASFPPRSSAAPSPRRSSSPPTPRHSETSGARSLPTTRTRMISEASREMSTRFADSSSSEHRSAGSCRLAS
jgi:hypothetical protein